MVCSPHYTAFNHPAILRLHLLSLGLGVWVRRLDALLAWALQFLCDGRPTVTGAGACDIQYTPGGRP